MIGLLFLLGNLFIFIPAMLYGGSLFIQTMFNVDIPLLWIAIAFALVGLRMLCSVGCAPWLFLMPTAVYCFNTGYRRCAAVPIGYRL